MSSQASKSSSSNATAHHHHRRYKCAYCGQYFDEKHQFTQHLIMHNEEVARCDFCDKSLAEGGKLTLFVAKKNGTNVISCKHCDKIFTVTITEDIKSPRGPDEENSADESAASEDDIAPERSSTNGERSTKRARSTGAGNSSSAHVEKRSARRNLRGNFAEVQSIKTETLETDPPDPDLNPLSCKICKTTFSRRFAMERHLNIHTGENPYPCNYCELRFRRSDTLTRHILRAHNGPKGNDDEG